MIHHAPFVCIQSEGTGMTVDQQPCLPSQSSAVIALYQPAGLAPDGIVDRLRRLASHCLILPAPATHMRAWIDQQYDMLVIAPFDGWDDPARLIALARAIAGGRPLMVLTNGDDMAQRLIALQAGADDAVDRLADWREIAARLGGLLRRHRLANGWLECAELQMDLIERRVVRAGRLLSMPLREFDLLANLARAADRIVPRSTLLRAVWRIDFDPGTNRVEVHMSRLRAKIDRGFSWSMLMNARGLGYALRSHRDARPHLPEPRA
jgi:two-component system, OmpR family, response regulator